MSELFTANVQFNALAHIVNIYQERGSRVIQELTPAIAEAMHAEVLEVFETEGYGEWPPFADSTLDRRLLYSKKAMGKRKKARRSRNPKLLQDTGNLINSLSPNWDEHMIEVYTNVPYAIFHVSPRPRRVIPLRDFFAIDTAVFEQDVVDMIDLHLRRPIAAE